MFIAGVISLVISSVVVMSDLEIVTLPEWWRDFSVSFFRVALFVAVVAILHMWKNLEKSK